MVCGGAASVDVEAALKIVGELEKTNEEDNGCVEQTKRGLSGKQLSIDPVFTRKINQLFKAFKDEITLV